MEQEWFFEHVKYCLIFLVFIQDIVVTGIVNDLNNNYWV